MRNRRRCNRTRGKAYAAEQNNPDSTELLDAIVHDRPELDVKRYPDPAELATVDALLQVLETQEIREDGKGRHTTTRRELVQLPSGALVIDTPGMRELALWADEDALDATFVARLRDGARNRALAGPCRAVDGDDHVGRIDVRRQREAARAAQRYRAALPVVVEAAALDDDRRGGVRGPERPV